MGKTPETTDKAEIVQLRPTRPCPICGKPSLREFYPFDTRRCADIDLNRWLSGAYAIPGEEAEPADGVPRTDENAERDA